MDANRELVTTTIARAADAEAELVIFPEATMRGFGRGRLDGIAEPLDGPFATAIADAAREHNIAVILGMFRPSGDGRVYNTALVVTATGEIHGYDKIHLFDAYGFKESDTVAFGELTPLVVELAGVQVGVAVCYDIRFASLFQELSAAGAEVMVVPTSWASGPGKIEQWRLLVQARALDSVAYVVGVDQPRDPAMDDSAAPTGVGHSLVVGPTGEILCELDDQPQLHLVEIDVDAVATARKANPVVANRRLT